MRIAISDGIITAVTDGTRWVSNDVAFADMLNRRIGLIEWVRSDIASPAEQMVMDAIKDFPNMKVIWEQE